MADIFLSYSRSDTNAAAKIVEVLEAEGWTVWWDVRLRAGDQWDKVIEREIDAARCVVVIWSAISVTRQWVRVEANFGLSRGILVPVAIQGAQPPLAFTLIHATDLSVWDGAAKHPAIRAVVQDVRNMLNGKAGPGKVTGQLTHDEVRQPLDLAAQEWEHIKLSSDPREFRAFIKAHHSGPYVWKAENRLADLGDMAWSAVLENPDEASLKRFLDQHFDSKYRDAAEEKLANLAPRPAGWKRVSVQERIAATTNRDVLLALWYDDPDAVVARFQALGYQHVPLLEGGQPASRWLKPGEAFRDLGIAPEMAVIPPGSYLMGSPQGEADERPHHKVTIPRAFAAGKYPVTFAEWDAAADAGGVRFRPDDRGWGRGARPVMNVSWNDAQAYIGWLSNKTGFVYRLLSEAEWEYACRANTTTAYYFGDTISRKQARFETLLQGSGKTDEVGSYPANQFGLYDMHGNVWEWCQDCWNVSYDGAPGDGSAWISGDCDRRVLRGGSWTDKPRSLRAAARNMSFREKSSSGAGFRVARELS
jgi:formylglycine-generating enzyme required for sulfatase activity